MFLIHHQFVYSRLTIEQEIAHFSYDDNHEFHLDDSSIRWYYPPDIGTDLNRGFETFRKHDDSKDEHLESLLRALMEKEKTTNLKTEADIITWRGMMTKVRLYLGKISKENANENGYRLLRVCLTLEMGSK